VQKHLLKEEKYFGVWTKIRFAYGFKNKSERLLWYKIKLVAISILCKININ
jgi:hypothetical protein